MTPELRESVKTFFKEAFAEKIKKNLSDGHNLSSFTINPLILTALSSGIFGEQTPLNMAKALLYPRVFGTSISTTFGEQMQRLCIKYLGADASATPGMDIEFIDKVDGKKVFMQLKAGPNTINSGDVKPIVDEMNSAYRLLQRNGVGEMPIFALGATYGKLQDISGHYKKINQSSVGAQLEIPIYIGQDFWLRMTGNPTFYTEMISIFVELFEQENYSSLLEEDLKNLAEAIDSKYFTEGGFDIEKV